MWDLFKLIGCVTAIALAGCGGVEGDGSGGAGGDGGGGDGGTGGSGQTCEGNPTGVFCDWDSDCASDNCYDDKCYGNSAGNPCDWDSDCDSGNCYDECCQPSDTAFVDDTADECKGAVDLLAACGILREADVATFKTALCTSSEVNPTERDLLVACVYDAANCDQTKGCAGISGPCTTDTDCNQTPGVASHEVCDPYMNNYCRAGCRDDSDCVTVTCDTFMNVCNPW